jgi:DNA-binding NtrC family response regulator
VRELKNTIEHAVVLAENVLISVGDLCMQPRVVAPARPAEQVGVP